jgi:hypothetical protein
MLTEARAGSYFDDAINLDGIIARNIRICSSRFRTLCHSQPIFHNLIPQALEIVRQIYFTRPIALPVLDLAFYPETSAQAIMKRRRVYESPDGYG